jgi:PIN domain nuclease of toxin-antitoxin system
MVMLDTHTWLFWINDSINLLGKEALKLLKKDTVLGVSVISCWEVGMLVNKQRIALNTDVQDWIDLAISYPKIEVVDLTPQIAVLSTRLPGDFHGDPADRIIVASALKNNCSLITKDKQIYNWGHVKTIW